VLLDLVPLRDGADVLPALAVQLGVRPAAGTALPDAVLDALRERRLLLVLDNCEHVANAVTALATAILRHAAAVTVLATSRVRLGLPEEQVVPLGPLPVPSPTADPADPAAVAVALFTDRARRVRPSFTLAAHNAALVAHICRQLDGLPLALELAAGMVGALEEEAIVAGLDSQLELAGRAGGERHRTLRAVVDSSFALLGESDRESFDALSIFPDWFDLAAAQELAGPGATAGLVRLVDTSLVLVVELADGRLRYRMLETLRQYGRERLQHGGRHDDAVRRLIGWAVGLAERAERELLGPNEAEWVHRLDVEFANLRAAWQQALDAGDLAAACRIAVAVSEHARMRSLHEPWAWAMTVGRRTDLPHDGRAVAVLGVAALAACRLGDPDAAEELAGDGLAHASGPGDGRWRCLHALAIARMMRGDHESAAARSAQAAAEPDCPPPVRACFAANVGLARSYAGTATPGELDASTRALQRGDWPSGQAWGWYVSAEAVRLTDPAESLRRLERALDLARGVGSVFIQNLAEVGRLAAALRLGDHATALRGVSDVIRGWQRSGSWSQQWTTLRTLAALFAELDADEPAAVLLAAADTAPEAPAIGDPELAAHRKLRARLQARLGPQRYAAATAWAAAQPRTAIVEHALQAVDEVAARTPAPAR
jgi:predicted ATPase